MQIFIPTSGRAGNQASYARLTGVGLKVTLAVPNRERALYSNYPHVLLVPDEHKIAGTRQYIIDHCEDENVCMVDDDLAFFKRRDDDRTKLRDITDSELLDAFALMDAMLGETYPHAGFASREGANRNTEVWCYNTRILRVLGYHIPYLRKIGVRFDDIKVMEDFHVALSILKSGRDSLVINDYAHNQTGGSSAPGGCSQYRTPEVQATAAMKLAELHAPFVKVVEKETKTAWWGGKRTDVTIYWKKARESAN